MSFGEFLKKAFAATQGDTAFSMDRDRPYNGQSHTDAGERGKTMVEGLTMRDVADCIVRGFLDAGGIETEAPIWDDVYKIDEDLDPQAVVQCTMCWVEKYMGIFPNIPGMEIES